MSKELGRRTFLKLAGGAGAAVALKAAEAVMPKTVSAHEPLPAGWPDNSWGFTRSGQEGDSREIEARPLPTGEGNFVVVHTGDVDYTDPSGYNVSYRSGETGGSITIIQGPSGKEFGGTDVWLGFRQRWSSVKVAQNPTAGANLNAAETARVINSQVESFRKSGINGRTYVLVIDGRSGNVKEERFIPPGQLAVEN